MPDLKISQLPDGGEPQDNDQLSMARGTATTMRLVWLNVRTWLEDRFVTSSGATTDGDVQVGAAATRGITSAGYSGADVARLDIDNAYAGDQFVGANRYVIGTSGAEDGYLKTQGAGPELVGSSDDGVTLDKTVTINGADVAMDAPAGFVIGKAGTSQGVAVGDPIGGVPSNGIVNALGFEVDGVAADGNVTSAATTDGGEIQMGRAGLNFGIEGSGVQVSDLMLTVGQDRTWAVAGNITGGMTILPFSLFVGAGETASISQVRHSLVTGTSASVTLQVDGGDATGFTGLTVTTTRTTVNPSDVVLAPGMHDLSLVINSVVATPAGLSFSVIIERTGV